LVVRVTTEQNTQTRNGEPSQASHRSIVFSHPTEPERLPTLRKDNSTSCATKNAGSSTPKQAPEMTAEQDRQMAERVAEQVVESIMTELFDASQLEEYSR
jgi:hypothetical protein